MFKKIRFLLAKKDFLFVFILIVLNSFIVFFQYLQIPKNLAFDEVEFAKLALSLDGKTYSVFSLLATGHSTLYFYILLLSFKLLGISTFALRLPSTLFGIANVIVFYFIMKKVFDNKIVVFASILEFCSLRWYFNFERFAFEATFLLFLELFSILFLLKALKEKKNCCFIVSALFAGLAFHSYYPGRIFFIVPFLFLLFFSTKKNAFIFLTTVVIIASPLLIYFTKHQDIRISQVSVFADQKLSAGQKLDHFGKNIAKTALMFNFRGDMNGRHNYPGKPALNHILGIIFFAGFLTTLARIGKGSNFFFLLYFFISLLPSLFSYEVDNPNMLRTFTAIPSVVFFFGMAMTVLLNRFERYRNYLLTVLIFLTALSSVYELRTYFSYQSRVTKNAFEIICDLPTLIKSRSETIPIKCRVDKNLF